MTYKRIVYATEFFPEEKEVADRALTIAKAFNAELYIVHVVEEAYSYGIASETETFFEWQEDAVHAATKMINDIGRRMDVPEEKCFIKRGSPKHVLLQTILEVGADLIVVGSHGRHGISLLLLGSTADAVVHRAQCDVLTVRIHR